LKGRAVIRKRKRVMPNILPREKAGNGSDITSGSEWTLIRSKSSIN